MFVNKHWKKIMIYNYDEINGEFTKNQTIQILDDDSRADIRDVMLIDLNNDGSLDLVVTVGQANEFQILFLFKERNKKFSHTEEHSFLKSFYNVKNVLKIDTFKHHPQAFQIFDNDIEQLRTYLIIQKFENERVVIYIESKEDGSNKIVEKKFKDFLSKDSKCKSYENVMMNKVSNKHSGAFIDLDMDCRPDLLIESISQDGRVEEIYYYTEQGFCLVDINKVPEGWSHVSFLDLDQNGSNDAVFLTGGLEMKVFLNKYHIGGLKGITKIWKEMCEERGQTEPPFVKFEDSKMGEV